MNFREIKKEYAKYEILAEIGGTILARDVDAKNFYMFGTEENFNSLHFPKNQRGTREEVRKELEKIGYSVNF